MPKKTVDEIVETGNHYLIQVKQNQPTLYKTILTSVDTEKPLDRVVCEEKKRGCQTTWYVSVYPVKDEKMRKIWKNLNQFVVVNKTVIKKGIVTQTSRFRITDLSLPAEQYAQAARGHWGIENKLHWVKDVNFNEDDNLIKQPNAAVNMSILTTTALNVLRILYDGSIKYSQILFGQNVKELFNIIRT